MSTLTDPEELGILSELDETVLLTISRLHEVAAELAPSLNASDHRAPPL